MNKNYFSSIETAEQAYWLGFIYADGYVSQKAPWTVIVSSIDHDHMQKLAEAVEYTGEIKITNRGGYEGSKPQSRLVLCRSLMCKDLNELGRNNEEMSIPDIPTYLIRDFIRGYFDGDGGIHPCKSSVKLTDGTRKQYTYLHSQIIGTKPFLLEIAEHFKQAGINTYWKDSKTDYMKYLCISGGNNLRAMHSYMYDGSTVSMQRKMEKWQALYSPSI